MRQYGNKTIADVGKYLVDSDGRRGFSIANDHHVTFEELPLDTNVEARPFNSLCIGGVFQIRKSDDIKRDLVNLIFSNDNQIAIILNRESSVEDAETYDFMQAWRAWFGEVVKNVKILYEGNGTKEYPFNGWRVGSPVEEGKWYLTEGGNLWEAIASGYPSSEIDSEYFDIAD